MCARNSSYHCIVESKFTCACRKCYDFSTMMKCLDVVFSKKPYSPNSGKTQTVPILLLLLLLIIIIIMIIIIIIIITTTTTTKREKGRV